MPPTAAVGVGDEAGADGADHGVDLALFEGIDAGDEAGDGHAN